MHLFGDVGQVEVGPERADQPDRRHEIEVLDLPQVGQVAVLDLGTDALDKVEQLLSLVADQRLAEQRRDQPDIGPDWPLAGHRRPGGHGDTGPCRSTGASGPSMPDSFRKVSAGRYPIGTGDGPTGSDRDPAVCPRRRGSRPGGAGTGVP